MSLSETRSGTYKRRAEERESQSTMRVEVGQGKVQTKGGRRLRATKNRNQTKSNRRRKKTRLRKTPRAQLQKKEKNRTSTEPHGRLVLQKGEGGVVFCGTRTERGYSEKRNPKPPGMHLRNHSNEQRKIRGKVPPGAKEKVLIKNWKTPSTSIGHDNRGVSGQSVPRNRGVATLGQRGKSRTTLTWKGNKARQNQ